MDVSITKNNDGSLSSGLYRKPTAGNTILHATSSHPQALIWSIPYSQYLRIKRNCSSQESFLREAGELRERLLVREYSHTCLKKAFKRANKQSKQDLLFPKKKSQLNCTQLALLPNTINNKKVIRKIIEKFWHLLLIEPNLNVHIPDIPAITYWRAKSLKDQLVPVNLWVHIDEILIRDWAHSLVVAVQSVNI